MARLLHTADWQLGLRLNFVAGEAAARLRAQRFATIERIAALAQEQGVDVVLVAGDVFDDNGVGNDTIQQARDALAAFGDIPVVLLPGNHDPATADSALARLGDCGPGIHVALTSEPLRFGAVEVFPCPLASRHQYDDPTAGLPARGDSRAIRIALAHGGVLSFSEAVESANRIDPDAVIARGFDYLALGDWHGTYRVNARAWYAGAHEPTRFKEKAPGNVLIVDIDAAGAEPAVSTHSVARTYWQQVAFEFAGDADIAGLEAWFAGLARPAASLAELSLHGVLSLAGRAQLDALLADYAERLALLRIETDAVQAEPTAADLAALHGEGFMARALATLRAGADPHDAGAMRLMYRLLGEDAD